jgi:Rrf2 family protein
MKLTSQEEYGLRCLLRIARIGERGHITIPEISENEGISSFYVAKLLRILRRAGFIQSARGQVGGYRLARPANQIKVDQVIAALGGRLFDSEFCEQHTGTEAHCAHSVDCAIRTVWRTVQLVVDQVLSKITLQDLEEHNEVDMVPFVTHLVKLSEAQETALRQQGPLRN